MLWNLKEPTVDPNSRDLGIEWRLREEAAESQAETRVAIAAAREANTTLALLLELEPGLAKYRATERNGWGLMSEWDLDGMKAAVEFRRQKAAHEKYATEPAIS